MIEFLLQPARGQRIEATLRNSKWICKRNCATAAKRHATARRTRTSRQLDVRRCILVRLGFEQTGNLCLFVCEVRAFSNKVRSSMLKVLLRDYAQQVNTK